MSLRAPDIADLGFQVGDHIRFTNTASLVRDRHPGGLVPGEGTLQLFTADEPLSDEHRLFLTGSMVNGLQAHSRAFVNGTIIPNPYYGLTRQFLGDP